MNESKKLSKLINKTIRQALIGWYTWGRIVRRYKLKKDWKTLCVLLPREDLDAAFYTLKLLDKAVYLREFDQSIVITTDSFIEMIAKSMCSTLKDVFVCSAETYDNILMYYNYTGIDDRFINASLEEPDARACKKLIGFRNITSEALIAYGIYGIAEYIPSGDGDKEEYLKFINCSKCN